MKVIMPNHSRNTAKTKKRNPPKTGFRGLLRNAVGLLGVIISHHLPPQLPLAGQRLTACVAVDPAIYSVLIGWKIDRLPTQPITAVLLVLPPFIDRFLDPYHLHHRGARVPPHVILVSLPCAFPLADPEPCHQYSPENKAGSRCNISRIFHGPCHKHYRKNETNHDYFHILHTSSFPPPWAGIPFYDTGGCSARHPQTK